MEEPPWPSVIARTFRSDQVPSEFWDQLKLYETSAKHVPVDLARNIGAPSGNWMVQSTNYEGGEFCSVQLIGYDALDPVEHLAVEYIRLLLQQSPARSAIPVALAFQCWTTSGRDAVDWIPTQAHAASQGWLTVSNDGVTVSVTDKGCLVAGAAKGTA